jgi:TctA family transporter
MGDAFIQGLAAVLSWPTPGWMLIGILCGLVVGLLPGLGGATFMSIAVPLAIAMPSDAAIALMIGFIAVGTTSDTIPAVLVAVPGSNTAQATILDGHQMAKQGQAARALGASFTAAVLGGILGAVLLTLAIPIIRPVVLALGVPELLMLALWGVSMVAFLSGGAMVKGVIAGGLGLLLGGGGIVMTRDSTKTGGLRGEAERVRREAAPGRPRAPTCGSNTTLRAS